MQRFTLSLILISGFLCTGLPGAADAAEAPPAVAGLQQMEQNDLTQWWQSLPQEERQLLRRGTRSFEELPPEKQWRIRERWERYQQMNPEEKQHLRERYERWRNLSPEEREKLRQTYRKFKQLPPEQRQQLREEFRQLRKLPDDQREHRREELHRRYFPNDTGRPGPGHQDRGWPRERGKGKQPPGGDRP